MSHIALRSVLLWRAVEYTALRSPRTGTPKLAYQ